MRQPWSTEPCYPLWAGCSSPVLLSLHEASEGRDSPSAGLVAPGVEVWGAGGGRCSAFIPQALGQDVVT